MGADALTSERSLSERDFYEESFPPEQTDLAAKQFELVRVRALVHSASERVISSASLSSSAWLSISDSNFACQAKIYRAIEKLYLSHNMPRDRRIADRLTTLYRDALSEGENICAESIWQFASFFLNHAQISVPKITLTPDSTIRSRWIYGGAHFFALEFIGDNFAKLVAELPRDEEETARYFGREQLDNVFGIAKAMGLKLDETSAG